MKKKNILEARSPFFSSIYEIDWPRPSTKERTKRLWAPPQAHLLPVLVAVLIRQCWEGGCSNIHLVIS